MRRGICLIVLSDGTPDAVRIDEGNMMTNDLDIAVYEDRCIEPPWQTLGPCSGQHAIGKEIAEEMRKSVELDREINIEYLNTDDGDSIEEKSGAKNEIKDK